MIHPNANSLMTLFSFITDFFQISSAKKDKEGQPTESKEKKPGILAKFTLDDEKIWLKIFYQLSPPQQDSITLFLENIPPQGDGLIEKMSRKLAVDQFRLIVTSLDVDKVPRSIEVITKSNDPNRSREKTEKYSDTKGAPTDHRLKFLKNIADEINGDIANVQTVYRRMVIGGIFPSDHSQTVASVKRGFSKAEKALYISAGITTICAIILAWIAFF